MPPSASVATIRPGLLPSPRFFHRPGQEFNATIARLVFQRRDEVTVLDHVGELLAGLDVAAESQKHRPRRVGEPAVGDHHVEDRLRLRGDGVPHADRLEQPARGGDDRGGPLVGVVASAQRRIGDDHAKRRAERLPQRDRQRQAGKTAAGNQYIGVVMRGPNCHAASLARLSAPGLTPRAFPYAKNDDMVSRMRCSVKRRTVDPGRSQARYLS